METATKNYVWTGLLALRRIGIEAMDKVGYVLEQLLGHKAYMAYITAIYLKRTAIGKSCKVTAIEFEQLYNLPLNIYPP